MSAYGIVGRNSTVWTNKDANGWPIWNSTSYGLILGNNSNYPLLIGSNSGITIASVKPNYTGTNSSGNAAVVLNSSGIGLRGATISLNTSNNENVLALGTAGITLASNAGISLSSGNINLAGGNIALSGGSIALNELH